MQMKEQDPAAVTGEAGSGEGPRMGCGFFSWPQWLPLAPDRDSS